VTTQPPEVIREKETACCRLAGENHPNAKLSAAKVIEMRQYAAEGASSFECGLVWDVSQKGAWSAIVGKTWKHVK